MTIAEREALERADELADAVGDLLTALTSSGEVAVPDALEALRRRLELYRLERAGAW